MPIPMREDLPTNSGAPGTASAWSRLPQSYAIPTRAPSLLEARDYCKRLATSHYENFSIATWFLPKELHQHFYNVYSYCRISDDLGDEVGDQRLSFYLLDRWEHELRACYAHLDDPPEVPGGPLHPVFIALAETIKQFGIPQHEFSDLLVAFRQDQVVTRYETFDDLLGYCRNSANPVGHLVLYLGGYSDPERQNLSDYTCTALQLANFWQDVAADFRKGRIYLPLEDMRGFGVSESVIAESHATEEFRALMKFEVERAREWFERGIPLASRVRKQLAIDVELFSRGGLEILKAIERQHYDVLTRRPVISKPRKVWLVLNALAGKMG